MDYTPDYIDNLLPDQVFVFGSNILGYHAGGSSRMAYKRFGAVWGQAEGLQGQSYAIPVDYGKQKVLEDVIKESIDRFIQFAKEHNEKQFLVTRIGCGIGGFKDKEMAVYFKEALYLNNVSLPRSFLEALEGKVDFNLERFVEAQNGGCDSYETALREIKDGKKYSHWIWYVFPQIKGLGHSYNSEFYGISGLEEAEAFLSHDLLGSRLREITDALLTHKDKMSQSILGDIDSMKVQSCMTLFDLVSPNDVFAKVLDTFYRGKRCEKTLWRLGREAELKKKLITFSKMTITKNWSIILSQSGKEVVMEPLVKAVYILFLKHPEGIAFKSLPDYHTELRGIYQNIKGSKLGVIAEKSIEDLTNPLNNSINEKCSRIRSAFLKEMDDIVAKHYYITGKSGEKKGVSLPQDMITWE